MPRSFHLVKRDSFLLRIDPRVLAAIRQWSEDEMRSMNGQIEYLLRQSLAKAGRLPKPGAEAQKIVSEAEDTSC